MKQVWGLNGIILLLISIIHPLLRKNKLECWRTLAFTNVVHMNSNCTTQQIWYVWLRIYISNNIQRSVSKNLQGPSTSTLIYSACLGESFINLAPNIGKCKATTFSSRCLGTTDTFFLYLLEFFPFQSSNWAIIYNQYIHKRYEHKTTVIECEYSYKKLKSQEIVHEVYRQDCCNLYMVHSSLY